MGGGWWKLEFREMYLINYIVIWTELEKYFEGVVNQMALDGLQVLLIMTIDIYDTII